MEIREKYIHNTKIAEILFNDNDRLYHLFKEISNEVPLIIPEEFNDARNKNVTTSYHANQVIFDMPTHPSQYRINSWINHRAEIASIIERTAENHLLEFYKDVGNPELIDFSLILDSIWMSFLKEGDYNWLHNHSRSTLSGVYYVDVPDQINDDERFPDGYLCLLGTSIGMTELSTIGDNNYFSKPETGKMILFPSGVHHTVYPFKGPGVRISIAFNLSLILETETGIHRPNELGL